MWRGACVCSSVCGHACVMCSWLAVVSSCGLPLWLWKSRVFPETLDLCFGLHTTLRKERCQDRLLEHGFHQGHPGRHSCSNRVQFTVRGAFITHPAWLLHMATHCIKTHCTCCYRRTYYILKHHTNAGTIMPVHTMCYSDNYIKYQHISYTTLIMPCIPYPKRTLCLSVFFS